MYEYDDGNLLLHFRNRLCIDNIRFPDFIPHKGEIACKFTCFWFHILNTSNHLLASDYKDKIVVKRLKMIPVEFHVRGHFDSISYLRWKRGETRVAEEFDPMLGMRLTEPIFDPIKKYDLNDVSLLEEDVIKIGNMDEREYRYIKETALSLYNQMYNITLDQGFILADVKFEFGKDSKGNILLADSLCPDDFTLWLKESHAIGVKQENFVNEWLIHWMVSIDLQKRANSVPKTNESLIDGPRIPFEVVEITSKRYIYAHKRITAGKLNEPLLNIRSDNSAFSHKA